MLTNKYYLENLSIYVKILCACVHLYKSQINKGIFFYIDTEYFRLYD